MAHPDSRREFRRGRAQQDWHSPTGETGRDPNELGEGFERRGWRPGSDYYGNNPERYAPPHYEGRSDAYEMESGDQRGRGPKGYRRSDERIREDVCESLTSDDLIDATNIDVTVKDCEVTLSGMVDSRQQKHRAEDLIAGIAGVKQVNNSLRIMAPPQW